MKFLDCTLRDGGYYTNWDFPAEVVEAYLTSLNQLPVDCIEVGYRSISKPDYLGQYFYCPVTTLERVRKLAPDKKIAVMFNEKDTTPAQALALLVPVKHLVDIVRLAVQPERFEKALELARTIQELGFEVAFNLMYMSEVLKDDAVLKKLPKLNGVVTYFSLVDSYGGVYPDDVRNTVHKVKSLVDMEIGFHGHNNLELALINSITALEAGCTWVDGTITGMGRGAGNLKTELFLTWLASQKGVTINFNVLADVVGVFEQLQVQYGWGTNLPYMVSGANSLPQKDVMDWLTKRTYSMNSIIQALQNQQAGQGDNLKLPLLPNLKKYKKAVLIAGGPSAIEHAPALCHWVEKNIQDVVLIHVSSRNIEPYQHLDVPQIYCLVGNEGKRLERAFQQAPKANVLAVLPPYPRKMGTYIPALLKDFSYELPAVSFTDKHLDSHTAVSLQTVLDLKVDEVYAIGFDGYSRSLMGEKEQELLAENDYLFRKFEKKTNGIISFTPSKYAALKVGSVYDLIAS